MSDDEEFTPSRRQMAYQRRRFTNEDDDRLKKIVQELGVHDWEAIAQRFKGRSARQCRDRYSNYLYKDIVNRAWTEEEDSIIIRMHEEIGSHWMQISEYLQGRSGNQVKNRWYKHIVKQNGFDFKDQNIPEIVEEIHEKQGKEDTTELPVYIKERKEFELEHDFWDEIAHNDSIEDEMIRLLYS